MTKTNIGKWICYDMFRVDVNLRSRVFEPDVFWSKPRFSVLIRARFEASFWGLVVKNGDLIVFSSGILRANSHWGFSQSTQRISTNEYRWTAQGLNTDQLAQAVVGISLG